MTSKPTEKHAELAATHERQKHKPLLSEAVLRGHSAVEIEHNGQLYRLQTTRQGKLILTK